MLACTPVDFELLDALARFRLLSIEQAERLGIARRWHIGERLKHLETAKLVAVIRRGRMQGPNVHTLTPKGAATLEAWAAETGEPRTVGVRRTPLRLGPHLTQRLAIVDVHISFRAWAASAGASVASVSAEFDPNPKGLEPATAVTFDGMRYTPDLIASFSDASGERWLFSVEVETGGMANSLENFRQLLPERLEIFQKEILENALGWPNDCRAARLLFVFSTVAMLEQAKRLVQNASGEVWQLVFFNSLPSVLENFASGWWQIANPSASPFPCQ
ncbi:replication-relaxation family protein [Pleomorphomonas carboxyditropha]|uniref:Uncharacterized protein n=1 Tax=Pleomorphomonas carboxyditropha TaxID=2023338 RepID=A0A2G9WN81_9HYPH|nr:replication-relaxation family protein [Pleomorphomonas carboxyditropha]PIO96167.1 hypothetical protein CJ014_26805 [Pleomorphomonas carboxyditropha]